MDFWTCLDAISFNKVLASVKAGRSIEDGDNSQFDERTEESSAEQYFQVEFSVSYFRKKKQHSIFLSSFMVIYLNNKI